MSPHFGEGFLFTTLASPQHPAPSTLIVVDEANNISQTTYTLDV
jgi:hypothetical protein